MKESCATCTVCKDLVPEQKLPRVLSIEGSNPRPDILVIDDVFKASQYASSLEKAHDILGDGIDFSFTSTVRCNYEPLILHPDQNQDVISRCSVWTNLLLENRTIILATPIALKQMKTGEEKKPGDLFKSRYGVVLVITPLEWVGRKQLEEYQTKMQRAYKEVGMVK